MSPNQALPSFLLYRLTLSSCRTTVGIIVQWLACSTLCVPAPLCVGRDAFTRLQCAPTARVLYPHTVHAQYIPYSRFFSRELNFHGSALTCIAEIINFAYLDPSHTAAQYGLHIFFLAQRMTMKTHLCEIPVYMYIHVCISFSSPSSSSHHLPPPSPPPPPPPPPPSSSLLLLLPPPPSSLLPPLPPPRSHCSFGSSEQWS